MGVRRVVEIDLDLRFLVSWQGLYVRAVRYPRASGEGANRLATPTSHLVGDLTVKGSAN